MSINNISQGLENSPLINSKEAKLIQQLPPIYFGESLGNLCQDIFFGGKMEELGAERNRIYGLVGGLSIKGLPRNSIGLPINDFDLSSYFIESGQKVPLFLIKDNTRAAIASWQGVTSETDYLNKSPINSSDFFRAPNTLLEFSRTYSEAIEGRRIAQDYISIVACPEYPEIGEQRKEISALFKALSLKPKPYDAHASQPALLLAQ